MSRRGAFPGSFNPLTIAHVEIARLARIEHDLDQVHLIISTSALDKPTPPGPPLAERVALVEADIESFDWLLVRVTELQLVADIAEGYDVVIMGADKWEQVNDVRYYDSPEDRDAALARLPTAVIAARAGAADPDGDVLVTPDSLKSVSSSAARAGAREQMAPHAREHWNDDE